MYFSSRAVAQRLAHFCTVISHRRLGKLILAPTTALSLAQDSTARSLCVDLLLNELGNKQRQLCSPASTAQAHSSLLESSLSSASEGLLQHELCSETCPSAGFAILLLLKTTSGVYVSKGSGDADAGCNILYQTCLIVCCMSAVCSLQDWELELTS